MSFFIKIGDYNVKKWGLSLRTISILMTLNYWVYRDETDNEQSRLSKDEE